MLLGIGTLIYSLVSGNSGESKYATMPMPGSTQARLPSGNVDVTFTADFAGRTVENVSALRMPGTAASPWPAAL